MDSKKLNLNQINRKEHLDELISFMPYQDKVEWAKNRIEEFLKWCEENKFEEVTVSFSGGKDSTVLLDLVLKVHKKIKSKIYLVPAYAIEITFPSTIKFIKDTVLKYQEKYKYLKNPLFKKPVMAWKEILLKKGYPIFSKQVSVLLNRLKRSKTKNSLTRMCFGIEQTARYKISYNRLFLLDSEMTFYFDENNERIDYFFSEKCCDLVKGGLKHDKRPSFIGTLANESTLRRQSWIANGCNILSKKHSMSRPLSLWNTNDIWKYVKENKLKINDAYNYNIKKNNLDDLRFTRLGCTSCPMGSHIEEIISNRYSKGDGLPKEYKYWNRFEKLNDYMPNLYEAQIWKTGMFHILCDMNIKIRNDKKYMEYYYKRRKEIENWYKNVKINILRVMIQIEMSDNNSTKWKYSISDFKKALKNFKIDPVISNNEIKLLRQQEKNKKIIRKSLNNESKKEY
ncbi:MAG: phosphoadenosine phosphosulfate reductase family protein [Malacoplasma sp.]|nr:phosphoadenosine phosphosulfate reductase family protein [Malacoplasma sp.]